MLKAAINGGRTKADHEAVPVTPEETAAAVIACLNAGADAIHLHVRSSGGPESLNPEDVNATLSRVLAVAPRSQIGISTGAWILPDRGARFRAAATWEVLPGFASVNFGEDGAVELATLLLSRGVDVEAGLCDATAAQIFLQSGLATSCLRVLLEPQEQEMQRALENVNAMEKVLRAMAISRPLLLHGTEATVWPMRDQAIARRYDIRVGLEDTLLLPDGTIARDNAELIKEAICPTRSSQAI
ncbi:MAG: hypothetical protein QOD75_2540 [Blastocatellia bacterium]|nr:hypothetical protein [Blastocatellia bacterium]